MRTEQTFLQQTPQGDLAILDLDADDPIRVNQAMADSGDPFDRWFRERGLELHASTSPAFLPSTP